MKNTLSSVLVLGLLLLSAYGTTERHPTTLECCTIRGSGLVNKVFIPPASGKEGYTRLDELDTEAETGEQEPVLTLFQVEYDANVPAEAQIVINYALLLWQNLIDSEVPIQVHVTWVSEFEDDNALATASSSFHLMVNKDSLLPERFEPIVIANRKAKYDLYPGSNDIDISVIADAPFYYGIDGNCPTNQYDLVTIILHEVAHGLGFASSANTVESDATLSDEVLGQLGYSGLGFNFDYFLEDQFGLSLIDPLNFENPSVELYEVFTGAQLYFVGPLTQAANYGNRAPLAAPRVWDGGSSVSHLNEGSYYGTSRNALMTPWIGLGEAIHDPGPITMGILGDIGWDYLWISQAKRKDSEDLVNPLRFTAKIESDSPLQGNPVLYYKHPLDLAYASAPMVQNPLTGIYYTDLPLDGTQTQISYYLEATASAGRLFAYPLQGSEQPMVVNLGPDVTVPTLSHTPESFIFSSRKNVTLIFNADDNTELGLLQTEVLLNGVPQNTFSYEAQGETTFMTALSFADLTPYQSLDYRFIATDRTAARNMTSLPAEGYFSVRIEPVYAPVASYAANFDAGAVDLLLDGFTVSTPAGFLNPILGTPHPYINGASTSNGNRMDYYAYLRQQILVSIGTTLSFDEVVLVEPGEDGAVFGGGGFFDYVAVEASLDQGVSWFALAPGWDSSDKVEWQNAYNLGIVDETGSSTTVGDVSLLKRRTLSIEGHPAINAGDTILIRFHLYSDPYAVGWGWAIDNLVIQPTAL